MRVVRLAVVVALVAAAAWAGLRTWEEQHRYPHSRDAYVRANVVGIAAQIDGPITELFVKDNQRVKKGEILFRIERGPYEAVVARAAGKVGRAEAEVFNARQILQRSERLARDQFVSREKLDSDLAGVRAAEAELELARAELWAAELNLSYTEVPAPADGSVTNFLVRVGTYVKRGEQLFALVEDKTWWVTANFMETYLRDIRPGQRAWITVDMYPGTRLRGRRRGRERRHLPGRTARPPATGSRASARRSTGCGSRSASRCASRSSSSPRTFRCAPAATRR